MIQLRSSHLGLIRCHASRCEIVVQLHSYISEAYKTCSHIDAHVTMEVIFNKITFTLYMTYSSILKKNTRNENYTSCISSFIDEIPTNYSTNIMQMPIFIIYRLTSIRIFVFTLYQNVSTVVPSGLLQMPIEKIALTIKVLVLEFNVKGFVSLNLWAGWYTPSFSGNKIRNNWTVIKKRKKSWRSTTKENIHR